MKKVLSVFLGALLVISLAGSAMAKKKMAPKPAPTPIATPAPPAPK